MKTLVAPNQNMNNEVLATASSMFTTLILNPLKKLTNVSPFLLLLVPVLLMMVLSFSVNSNANQEEAALKLSGKTTSALIKATTKLLK